MPSASPFGAAEALCAHSPFRPPGASHWFGRLLHRDVWRFWSKVTPRDAAGCTHWTAKAQNNGYGVFNVRGTVYLAHRLAYYLSNGPIPEGMHICHRCDTPSCVNPDHLFLGTPADNMDDMTAKGRRVAVRGEDVARAILTEAAVRDIRASADSPRSLGARYGVAPNTITNVRLRRIWKHVA